MGFKLDNRQSRRMLEKMGLNLEEMPEVSEVVIKTKEKDIIIKSPQVSKLKSKGIDMYQIMGNDIEEVIKEDSKISEEDVLLVSQQANVNLEIAKNALEESNGDLAQAILKLK
ncbi:MAG: nascent polypeptide-associated complex protein [Thaumarchaeota archaeon]|nr:nascent polypeptide-associated complex protein [Nitrososphaerota archaeon]|tara:strand:+ start:1102 stop:1440 length:339 start_codon:yes stop_codon:yes gene_type:complete